MTDSSGTGQARAKPEKEHPIRVDVNSDKILDILHARDISETGIGLYKSHKFRTADLDRTVTLSVTLPEPVHHTFTVTGEIMHSTKDAFGVHFLTLKESDRERIREYIAYRAGGHSLPRALQASGSWKWVWISSGVVLLTVFAAVFFIFRGSDNKKPSSQEEQDRSEVYQSIFGKPTATPTPMKGERPARRSQRDTRTAPPRENRSGPPARSPRMQEEPAKSPSSWIDPVKEEALRRQVMNDVFTTYEPLLQYLSLSENQMNSMRELLTDKNVCYILLDTPGQVAASGNIPANISEELTQAIADIENQLMSLLDAENYSVYEQYDATLEERMQVEDFDNLLGTRGLFLTSGQQHELILLLYDMRRQGMPPSQFIDETLLRAEVFLDENQLFTLADYLQAR